MTPRGTPAEVRRGRQRIRVRRLRPGDVPALARLYFETVHAVNARDYAPRQLWAWAPRVYPDAFWRARLCRYRVFVVELDGQPVAFGELDAQGEVDCFYVHRSHQGRGVGRALMEKIEVEARRLGCPRLRADVSLTAEPFFRRLGFRLVRRQVRVYRNRAFQQASMEKPV